MVVQRTKTKYLLYSFKCKHKSRYSYYYETDSKYFVESRPPQTILNKITQELKTLDSETVITNPWQEWNSNNIQKIITSNGVCINYLKSTDGEYIQKKEDLKLLELYSHLVDNFDISKPFGFKTIEVWHENIFETIYPFAGKLRTVDMSKGTEDEAWIWRVDFLNGIPELDKLMKEITRKEYSDIDIITKDLAQLISDFLFIHPFREGNGRVSRLLCDIILAKSGFPMIGLSLKKEDNYIKRVHAGYECDYEPMKELLKEKILQEIRSE